MNMSDLDYLLNNQPIMKAPSGFTNTVMQSIRSLDPHRPAGNRSYQLGVRLIAASLITLIINLTPVMDLLIKQQAPEQLYKTESIRLDQVSDTIEHLTLQVNSIFYKPFEYLIKQFNKEETIHGN